MARQRGSADTGFINLHKKFIMKKLINIIILLLATTTLQAQMVIQSGATFITTGSAVITLQNSGLKNNGTLIQQPGGKFIFMGSNTDTISGTAGVGSAFDSLQIAKTGAGKLVLQQTVVTNAAVRFTSGNIDLAGNTLQLASTAILLEENPASRVIDNAQGGYVTTTRILNAPLSVNPGNLGAIITSTQNLGNTTIRRGHNSQVNVSNTGNSINRYYDIIPTNNTAVNATLRLTYFDTELNGLMESDLNMYKSSNNTNWTTVGYTTRDASANYVEKTGITDFSRWTLSSFNNPLPILFTSFQAGCNNNSIGLDWTIEQERNVSHFGLQRSEDAIIWKDIAIVPFVSTTHHYSYTDANSKGFYRVAVVDIDGSKLYSDVVYEACKPGADAISIWPNPTTGQVYIALTVNNTSTMALKVYDGKGSMILQQTGKLTPGDNNVNMNIQYLASGVYWVMMDWNNGAERKTVRIVKQ
jgi:hypothetical protein